MCFHLNVKDKGQKMENTFLSSSYILLISRQFNYILLSDISYILLMTLYIR